MEKNINLPNKDYQLGKVVKISGNIETFLVDNYRAIGKKLNEKINSRK